MTAEPPREATFGRRPARRPLRERGPGCPRRRRPVPRGGSVAVLVGLLPALVAPAAARPKTDVITLDNGDRVTCEILSLQRGKLKVKTDDMGTVSIEWDKVAAVNAEGLFEIEDLLGNLYYAPLTTVPDEGLEVPTETGVEVLPLISIARLMYIESSFWRRLSGSVSVGLGYTKSSDLAEFNADAVVKYTRPTFSAELEASSFLQRQEGVEDTTRNSIAFSYSRTRGNRQFLLGQASAMQNPALGYDLRAGLTGAWGRYLVRDQGSELVAASGIYVNREVPVEGETVSNIEALVAADWAIFSYDFPKTDIEFSTVLILGLTDWGRYRVDLNARFDRELFDDFTLVIKGFYNYDSKPPTQGAAGDDYQASLALGYSF